MGLPNTNPKMLAQHQGKSNNDERKANALFEYLYHQKVHLFYRSATKNLKYLSILKYVKVLKALLLKSIKWNFCVSYINQYLPLKIFQLSNFHCWQQVIFNRFYRPHSKYRFVFYLFFKLWTKKVHSPWNYWLLNKLSKSNWIQFTSR